MQKSVVTTGCDNPAYSQNAFFNAVTGQFRTGIIEAIKMSFTTFNPNDFSVLKP